MGSASRVRMKDQGPKLSKAVYCRLMLTDMMCSRPQIYDCMETRGTKA
jgi:hypothetical protein